MKAVVVFILFFAWAQSFALTINTNGEELTLSGSIEVGDESLVQNELGEHPETRVIVFQDCMGGDVSTGYRISQIILKGDYDTVASRLCQSSCAYAFMAGHRRTFSTMPGMHAILLHVSKNTDTANDVVSKINAPLLRYLGYLSAGKISPSIMNLIGRSNSAGQGVFFVKYIRQDGQETATYYCNGSESGVLAKCEKLKDSDPAAMGIIAPG